MSQKAISDSSATLTAASTSRRSKSRGALWREILARRRPLASVYPFGPMERVQIVKEGVPARLLALIAEDMAITKYKLYDTLGLARATVNRKLRDRSLLSQDESERALGIARLIGQVSAIVQESAAEPGDVT